MAWRVAAFDDDGLGCVAVPPAQLALMEPTDDPDELRAIVEASSWPTAPPRNSRVVSTTRSQLYRLARDLGNVEAVEHGYTGRVVRAAGGAPSARLAGSFTARATARSTTSSAPSASGRAALSRLRPRRGEAVADGAGGLL